ncbi:MAG: sulfurtransferase TusA family protein [Nitrospiraceae bacterium]
MDQSSNSTPNHTNQPGAATTLDLRGVICPYNFVKTKLKLETMAPGAQLDVWLDDGDPIKNVPQSVTNEGHTVLAKERDAAGHYRVLIQRRDEDE